MEEGDVVQLKSGGPTMTVLKKDGTKKLICTWFDKDGELKKESINVVILKPYIEIPPQPPEVFK